MIHESPLHANAHCYLEIYQWQLDHIQEGLCQADAGEFATDEEVAAAFARWRSLK